MNTLALATYIGETQINRPTHLECVNSMLYYPCMLWDSILIPSHVADKDNKFVHNQCYGTMTQHCKQSQRPPMHSWCLPSHYPIPVSVLFHVLSAYPLIYCTYAPNLSPDHQLNPWLNVHACMMPIVTLSHQPRNS